MAEKPQTEQLAEKMAIFDRGMEHFPIINADSRIENDRLILGERVVTSAREAIMEGADPSVILNLFHKHEDGVTAIKDFFNQRFGKEKPDVAELSQEEFQEIIRHYENFLQAALELGERLDVVPRAWFPQLKTIHHVVASKVLTETGREYHLKQKGGKKAETVNLDTEEKLFLADTVSTHDYLTLEKFAHDAGGDYGRIVGRLRRAFLRGSSDSKSETMTETSKQAVERLPLLMRDQTTSEVIKQLIFSIGDKESIYTEDTQDGIPSRLMFQIFLSTDFKTGEMNADADGAVAQVLMDELINSYFREGSHLSKKYIDRLIEGASFFAGGVSDDPEKNAKIASDMIGDMLPTFDAVIGEQRVRKMAQKATPDILRDKSTQTKKFDEVWQLILTACDEVREMGEQTERLFDEKTSPPDIFNLESNRDLHKGNLFIRMTDWGKLSSLDGFLLGLATEEKRGGLAPHQELGKNRAVAQVEDFVESLVKSTDNTGELLWYLENSHAFRSPLLRTITQKPIVEKLNGMRKTIPLLVERLTQNRSPKKFLADVYYTFTNETVDVLFSPDFLTHTPNLLPQLFELLGSNRKQSYAACCILGHLVATNEEKEYIVDQFVTTFFAQSEKTKDPKSLFLLRCVTEQTSKEGARLIMERIVKDFSAAEIDIVNTRPLLGKYTDVLKQAIDQKEPSGKKLSRREKEAMEREKYQAGIHLLRAKSQDLERILQTISGARDMAVLIDSIQQHRSIELGDDPRQFTVSTVASDSPLASLCESITVKKIRNTAYDQKSLACYATIVLEDKSTLYCATDATGNLTIRLLNHAAADEGQIRIDNAEKNKISPLLLQEIQYIILKTLEAIYVRRPETRSTGTARTQSSEQSTETGNGLVDQLPLSTQRTTSETMHIDLTTAEKRRRTEHARVEKIAIETNRAKVLRLFRPLIKREFSETIPDETTDVILYRRQQIKGAGPHEWLYKRTDGPDAYADVVAGTLSLNDIYVRTVRAHATPLPYLRTRRETKFNADPETVDEFPLDEVTGDTKEDFQSKPYYSVTQRRPRDIARTKYETFTNAGGEEIHQEAFSGFLSYDVDDTPEYQLLLEKIKDPIYIDQLIEAKKQEILKERNDKRQELREKYLLSDTPDMQAYIRHMEKTENEAETKMTAVETMWREVQSRSHAKDKVIHFAEGGFPFEQTFNQGQFESVAELIEKMN